MATVGGGAKNHTNKNNSAKFGTPQMLLHSVVETLSDRNSCVKISLRENLKWVSSLDCGFGKLQKLASLQGKNWDEFARSGDENEAGFDSLSPFFYTNAPVTFLCKTEYNTEYLQVNHSPFEWLMCLLCDSSSYKLISSVSPPLNLWQFWRRLLQGLWDKVSWRWSLGSPSIFRALISAIRGETGSWPKVSADLVLFVQPVPLLIYQNPYTHTQKHTVVMFWLRPSLMDVSWGLDFIIMSHIWGFICTPDINKWVMQQVNYSTVKFILLQDFVPLIHTCFTVIKHKLVYLSE